MDQSDFAKHYTRKRDEDIIELARRIHDLIPEAVQALEAEIQKRGLIVEESASVEPVEVQEDKVTSVRGNSEHMGDEPAATSFPIEHLVSVDRTGNIQISSSVFILGALVTFIVGIVFVRNEVPLAGLLILTITPCLLLYPLVRAVLGGGGWLAAIMTVVFEEWLKHKIKTKIDDQSKR
jgi:hypothetical protein